MTQSADQDPAPLIFDREARDQRRLSALRDYDILDTPPEEAFDRLTRLAADLVGVEVAFVAFLDTDRQWFKSSVGLDQTESSLAASFCTYTIESDGPLVIEDAADEERTRDSAFVTEEGLRFYAGVPICAPGGEAIGTFSIMASEPRSLSDEEVGRLEDLAEMASEELEHRREARTHEETARRFEAILKDPNMLVGVLSPDGTLLEANETLLQYVEESEDEVLGRPFWETPWWPAAMQNDVRSWIERAVDGEYVKYEADLERSGGEFYRVEGTIRPVTGDDGSPEALVVSARDVTEQKRREEKTSSLYTATEQLLKAQTATEVADRIEEVVRETFEYPLNGVHFAREGQLVPARVSPSIAERWPDMPPRDLDGDGLGARAYRSGKTTTAADLSTFDTTIGYKDLGAGACVPIGDHGVISIASTEVDGIDAFDVRLLEILAADAAAVLDRIEHEQQLERQNDLFAKAQEIAQVGAWEYDVQESELRWTDEVYRIYGLPKRSDLTVQTGIEHYHPADRSTIRDAFTRAVEEGESYDVELRLMNEEGEQRWVRTRGEPQFEEGGVVRVRGAIQDITEAKTRERALHRSEERWRSLLEHLRSGVHVTVGGTIEYVNPAGVEILGAQDPEEIIGRNSLDFVPEDAAVDPEARLETLERGNPTAPAEHEIVGLDDTRRRVQVYSVPIGVDGKQGRQTVFRDVTEERRAQRQLREREERIRGLANSIPGVVYQFYAQPDGTYGCHFVSERAEDLLGIASDPETFFERFLDHVPMSVRDDLLRSVEEAVEAKTPWRYELPFDRPDGERIWLSGASRPVQRETSSGKELVFNGVLLDVTERNRVRRRLERYHEYTGRLLDAMDDLFFVFDAEGNLRRWNSRVATASGYTEEELEGMSVRSLVPEEDRERTAEAVAEVLSTGRSKLDTQLLTKSGETVPYEVTGNRVEHPDGDLRLVSIGRDVTERNRREARLRDRGRKIESLYDTTKSLLTAERPEAVSKRIHDVITTVFDYPFSNTGFVEDEELVPVDVTTGVSEGVPSPEPQPMDGDSVATRALQTGETVVVEDVQALDNDIDYGTLQSVAALPIAGHGVIVLGQVDTQQFNPFDLRLLEVLGTYASMVLDRLQGEEALRRAKEEAEAASRLKSAMLANMSHEIRTPLTSVTGFAELLKENLEGRMRTFAEQIYNGGTRLQKTLDSVLQLSRLEAGVYEMERTSLSLGALIEETVDMLRLSAEEKELRLNAELPDGPVEGAFNEGAVNRILENLLENAIKFTPEGGTIEVRARTDGDDAVLEVEDTGVGISEEALPQIFSAFQQESAGMAREYEGSGLGLSIVKRLAEAHGGTVDVDSEKGVGTRFTVRLPRATPDDA